MSSQDKIQKSVQEILKNMWSDNPNEFENIHLVNAFAHLHSTAQALLKEYPPCPAPNTCHCVRCELAHAVTVTQQT